MWTILLAATLPLARAELSIRAYYGCDEGALAANPTEPPGVMVDDVPVTGTPAAEALANLSISEAQIRRWIADRRLVLAVGEGYSDLVPTLHARGVNVFGVDLWYDPGLEFPNTAKGDVMRKFIGDHRSRLWKGGVRDLPFGDRSVGVVLTHQLFNNLGYIDTLGGHHEIVRVLDHGGEHFEYSPGWNPEREKAQVRFESEAHGLLKFGRHLPRTLYFRKR